MIRMIGRFSLVVGILIALRTTCGAQTCDQRRRLRPVLPGVSISSVHHATAGTLGAIVRANGREYLLTAGHVLGELNQIPIGHPVVQPGGIDGGTADDVIAHISFYVPTSKNGVNQADAAIAELKDPDRADARILNIGGPSGTAAPASRGMDVQKMGRTSCVTQGRVSAVNVDIMIPFGHDPFVHFSNQILVEGAFSSPGDAGALVTTTDSCPRPVGLIIAGSNDGRLTVVTPIATVLSSIAAVLGSPSVSVVPACFSSSGSSPSEAIAEGLASQPEVIAASATRDSHHGEFQRLPGYLGSGIGMDSVSGQPVIEIYLSHSKPNVQQMVPETIDDVPIRLVEIGPLKVN